MLRYPPSRLALLSLLAMEGKKRGRLTGRSALRHRIIGDAHRVAFLRRRSFDSLGRREWCEEAFIIDTRKPK